MSDLLARLSFAAEWSETEIDIAGPDLLRQAANEIEKLRGLLLDANLQIEYLHDKFRPTGTGEATLARIRAALSPATGANEQ
jgi:hypothetical protein